MKKRFILLLFSFSSLIAQFTWTPPVTLSTSLMDNSSDPQVVTDTNGNATAAWVENGSVQASFYNGNWNTPTVLSILGGSSPRLVCDGSGNVTAIWLDTTGVVYMATLPLNGNWSLGTPISLTGASLPTIAVNTSGNLAIAWQRGGVIEAVTKKVGGLLSLTNTISAANSSNPNISVGDNGRVVAVWQTILGTGRATVESATQSSLGGSWGSAVNILPGASAFDMNYPVVSVDQHGNADVLWYRYLVTNGVYSNVFVYSASLPSTSSSWSAPLQISDTGIGNPANLFIKIKTDLSGNKVALWSISFDGQSYLIESLGKLVGGVWTHLTFLQPKNLYAFHGGISTDALGDVAAVTMFFNGSSTDIRVAESSASQVAGQLNWTSYATLSSAGSNNAWPNVSVNTGQASYATAIWMSANGSHTVVQACTGVKPLIQPPANLTVSQNVKSFGVFNDYYNTLTWTASSDAIGYVIYRNGIMVAQLSSSTIQYIDHNAVQNGSVTYGVATMNNQFALSSIATVSFP